MRPEPTEFASTPTLPTMNPKDTITALAAKEFEVGITDYVSMEAPGFQGTLKKRYTDFLVNEILPNGRVVHLQKLGSAAVSQPDENHKPAIRSEGNGTDASSSTVPGSSAQNPQPAAALEVASGSEKKLEQSKEHSMAEGTSPVRLSDLKTRTKLTCRPGLR